MFQMKEERSFLNRYTLHRGRGDSLSDLGGVVLLRHVYTPTYWKSPALGVLNMFMDILDNKKLRLPCCSSYCIWICIYMYKQSTR